MERVLTGLQVAVTFSCCTALRRKNTDTASLFPFSLYTCNVWIFLWPIYTINSANKGKLVNLLAPELFF